MSSPNKIAATRASERLVKAIDDLAGQGLRPHCAGPDGYLWLSESPEDRANAIKLCRGCPIFRPCGEAASARREQFGVWSGQDRTRQPNRVGRPPKTAVKIEAA